MRILHSGFSSFGSFKRLKEQDDGTTLDCHSRKSNDGHCTARIHNYEMFGIK